MIGDVVRDALDIVMELAEGRGDVRAVRHPLGFLCLPVRRESSIGVCVHLWTRELSTATPTTSAVHSHSWDLESQVLYGQVGNATAQVFDDAVAATHRVFEVHSAGELDEIRATGRLVRAVRDPCHTTGPGGTYLLGAGHFHSTEVDRDSEAATVVIGRTTPGTDLSLGAIDGLTHRIVRQSCGAEETTAAAAIVLRELARRPHTVITG